jgi:hypothetical protein
MSLSRKPILIPNPFLFETSRDIFLHERNHPINRRVIPDHIVNELEVFAQLVSEFFLVLWVEMNGQSPGTFHRKFFSKLCAVMIQAKYLVHW